MKLTSKIIREVNYVLFDLRNMTRPKLANYLLGLGIAIALFSAGTWATNYSVGHAVIPWEWWEILIGRFILFIGATVLGWYGQITFNIFQGEGHQKADADNAEEKRSGYGAVIGTALLSVVFLFHITNFLPFVLAGCSTILLGLAIWGIPALYKKLTKK